MSLKSGPKNVTGVSGEEEALRAALAGMVRRLTSNAALRQDLLQEALVHLWLTQSRRPGQTRSWYLQSCKFHLQHYLASGRSIDSAKRRASQLYFGDSPEDGEGFPDEADAGNTVLTWVSAREIMSLLARHLSPSEKAVLDHLANGLGPREIGRELRISHTLVIRHRRRIASLLTRLGIASAPVAPAADPNGKPQVAPRRAGFISE
jgi:DNA-directed RNA polymerase specialized sigma24 family protein